MYLKTRDDGHSPLLYRGLTPQIIFRNQKIYDKYLTRIVYGGYLSNLSSRKNKVKYTNEITASKLELNYLYARKINAFNNIAECWLGGLMTNTADMRFYSFLPNNSFAYQFSNAINASALFMRSFYAGIRKRPYKIGFEMDIAILAHVLRPSYIGLAPAEVYAKQDINIVALFVNGNKIALPDKFFRIQTETYIDRFFLKTPNLNYRLSYKWALMVDRVSNVFYSAYHGISFTRILHKEKIKYESSIRK
ncbi:MAG: hypothetical protein NZ529_09160 [Cytophagaceae bacterium]|nr:hypothetical protein [Cytophagaceae bacterium]MDW8456952.1 hypothetical protein [Cytophagaceae bacterium]